MLSNTADTKPSPIAVCQDAAGSFSTGIIVADKTSDRRKILPLKLSGSTSQSGRRRGTLKRSAITTDAPIKGKRSETSGNFTFITTLVTMAATRMKNTIPSRIQST